MTETEKCQLHSQAISAKNIKVSTMVSGVKLVELFDENAALHREIVALGTDKQDLTSHLESVKQENSTLVACNNRLTREIEKLNFEADELKEQCLLVDRANTGLEADVEQLRVYLDEARTENATLRQRIETLEIHNATLEADLGQESIYLDDARKQNAALKEQIDVFIQERDIHNRDIRKLKEQNARLVEMVERLEWKPSDEFDFNFCGICFSRQIDGHTGDCSLGNLLKEVKNETSNSRPEKS